MSHPIEDEKQHESDAAFKRSEELLLRISNAFTFFAGAALVHWLMSKGARL